MRLLCYDPGGTTGVAYFVDHCLIWVAAQMGTLSIPEQIAQADVVLYETATWRGPAFNPVGFEVIGVIKHFCTLQGIKPISRPPTVLRGPRTWPRVAEYARRMKSQHARDAFGHGVAYLGLENVVLPDDFCVLT